MAGVNWEHFDHLVESYASAYVYADKLPALQEELASKCLRISNDRVTIDDFTNFLEPSVGAFDTVNRKLAWCAQHALTARAWSIGQKVLHERDGKVFSPIVDQIARLGASPTDESEASFAEWKKFVPIRPQSKIDVVLVDLGKRVIFPLKGCSHAQAAKRTPKLELNPRVETLFGTEERVVGGICAEADALATLLQTRELLRAKFLGFKIIPLYMVVDDPAWSWNFQCIDVTDIQAKDLETRRVGLDDFPVYRSSLDFADLLKSESDAFAFLPSWGGNDPLASAPVDRPTRVMMLLTVLWQCQAANRQNLVFVPATKLASMVTERYGVEYPDDLRRHDIEDCLKGGGYVRRSRSNENNYAITPKGMARIFMIKRKFAQSKNVNDNLGVMDYLNSLATMWYEHQAMVFSPM